MISFYENTQGIRNAHYLENSAVDCEVLFDGETEFVPYTAMQDDTAPTGQHIWEKLQSGKRGEIAPFTITPELIAATEDAKKREIEAWRTEQEAQPFTFEWNVTHLEWWCRLNKSYCARGNGDKGCRYAVNAGMGGCSK